MKTTKAIAVWFIAYMAIYLVLSAIGCLFFKGDGQHFTYSEIAGDRAWFIVYSLFIGWWAASVISMDYYETK